MSSYDDLLDLEALKALAVEDVSAENIESPAIRRIIEDIQVNDLKGGELSDVDAYNRMHNRHNRSLSSNPRAFRRSNAKPAPSRPGYSYIPSGRNGCQSPHGCTNAMRARGRSGLWLCRDCLDAEAGSGGDGA